MITKKISINIILIISLILMISNHFYGQSLAQECIADSRLRTNVTCTDWQTTSAGSSTTYQVMAWTWGSQGCGQGNIRSLMKFDLNTDLNPQSLYDNRAVLSLYFPTGISATNSYLGSATGNPFYIQQVTEDWDEFGVTWSNQPNSTTIGEISVPSCSSSSSTEDYFIDVSSIALNWICNGVDNFGVKLKLVNEGTTYQRVDFCSRENATISKHPTLTLEYANIEATGPANICEGENFTINCVLNNAANPTVYNFSWEHLESGTIYNTQNLDSPFSEIGLNTYVVTASNPWCQTATDTVVINVDEFVDADAGEDINNCDGTSVSLTATGGTSYIWSTTETTATINVSPTVATTYYVTISNGVCTAVDDVTVNISNLTATNLTIENASCFGLNDASIDIDIDGGTEPYSYLWSNSQITQDLTNITAGNYTITATDINNCEYESEFIITQPDILDLQIYTQDVLCYGENSGEIDLIISGGTFPYSYLWSDNQITQDLTNITAGNYTVTVTDANNCQDNTMVQIEQPDLPLHANITSTDVNCFGEGNGMADLDISGGTPPYIINWNNGEISENISELIPGVYSVIVHDENNCTTSNTVQISQPDAALNVNIHGNNVTCNGGNDGNVYIEISGGITPYHYEWSNGSFQQNLIGVTADIYTVTVTDANNCHFYKTFEVTEPEAFYLQLMDNPTICYGQSTEIGISIISGGTEPYTILWNNGDTGITTFVNPLETETYSAEIVDSTNCVSEEFEITVKVFEPITMEVNADVDSVCPGTDVRFDVIINGGGLNTNEVIVDGAIMTLPIVLNVICDTVFDFKIYDSCNFDSIIVSYPIYTYPLPQIDISTNFRNGCAPLTVRFQENSEDVGQRYIWNFDEGDFENLSFDNHPVHTFYNSGTYHVGLEIITVNNCSINTTIGITVFPNPEAVFTANTTTVSIVSPIVNFTNYSVDGFFYNWNFGDGSQSTALNPSHEFIMPGTYHVNMITTSLYGCSDSTGVDISVAVKPYVYPPTAFSPNNDNLNETFKVIAYGIDPESYQMFIYSRWGENIFHSKSYEEEWDGCFNTENCPQGVYAWVIYYMDLFGKHYTDSGIVTLFR